jgi:energy-coupling factor transporter ATP-binding protein EcfA2
MIESIEFKNFKALRDTKLPLAPCTIIVGPNGSGKSTVLQALGAIRNPQATAFPRIASFAVREAKEACVSVRLTWAKSPVTCWQHWQASGLIQAGTDAPPGPLYGCVTAEIADTVKRIRVFSLDAQKLAGLAPVQSSIELAGDGAGLAAVLDGMRDEAPEQFRAVESHINEWLPEFDRILFDRPNQGSKSIALRTREGQYKVPACDLSQGTLIALALLTLAYHPTPPSLIALEEPDRGVHPHLLRHVQDALHRLSNPESCGEQREPVQVIATTHSPSFLNLFEETPEEIVVANKVGLDVQFERLTDQPHFRDIFVGGALGDVWYSGVLGGVPARS